MHIAINTGILEVDEVTALRERESERAAQLSTSGNLLRLWRVPGRWENWGLWEAQDETELQAVLESLPLHPFMCIAVHPLVAHPSDPGDSAATLTD